MKRPAGSELLERIYTSALEPDGWPEALEAIAASFDAEAGLVYFPGYAHDPTDFAQDSIAWNAPDFDLCANVAAETGRRDAQLMAAQAGMDLASWFARHSASGAKYSMIVHLDEQEAEHLSDWARQLRP